MSELSQLEQWIRKDFDQTRRILSFEEYLGLVREKPEVHLRGSAQYACDMMESFGSEGAPGAKRYFLFEKPVERNQRRVVGQENVENRIFTSMHAFTRQGINNKLLLLHGPNGSAKSSLIQALMSGFEGYSKTPEGAVYTFSWVFPLERSLKGSMGLGEYSTGKEGLASYARLPEEEILSKIGCDLKDHPILLIPVEQRRAFIEMMLGKPKADVVWASLPQYLAHGGPCHRCKQIFDAILIAQNGDLKKVLRHIQVERFFYSRRYRKGLVTIEPQMHVDAQYQLVSYNKNVATLPSALQGLNLYAVTGDLIDGNRGVIEFSDLLKRPIDSFKYLLIACETSSVNIGATIAQLDTLWLGSTNELQLDAFKEFPDFTSFKARMDLIRVPYLLSPSLESQIYEMDLEQLSRLKHVAPHTAWTLGLWAVLTRLKKPNSINYPPNISSLVSNLTPLEKARLYDDSDAPASLPASLSPEERKLMRASIKKIKEEYLAIPYYEGRMGASAREMRSILFSAAENPEFPCLSPLAILREMDEFVKRVSEYEFLKQDVKDGFHDATEFINVVRNEYLTKIDREVRDSIGLYDSTQWEDFLKRYVIHVSAVIKKEKIKNQITGKNEDPDLSLIEELEKIVDAPADSGAKEAFRNNIISQVGAWALDNPGKQVVYARVFPEFWTKLEKHYYESQRALLAKMHNALQLYDKKDPAAVTEEAVLLARKTVQNMAQKQGYCESCAKEVITFLMRSRY